MKNNFKTFNKMYLLLPRSSIITEKSFLKYNNNNNLRSKPSSLEQPSFSIIYQFSQCVPIDRCSFFLWVYAVISHIFSSLEDKYLLIY